MRYSEGKTGRVFVLRLEDREILHECIERFAREKGIKVAKVQLMGGADKGSKLVVGPEHGRSDTIKPMVYELDEMHEIVGNGTIVPDENGTPLLHCHITCGRKDRTLSGDIRNGVIVWHIIEVVITEIVDCPGLVRQSSYLVGIPLLWPDATLE